MKEQIQKNNAGRSFIKIELEEDFSLLTCQNNTVKLQSFVQSIQDDLIQFHFCLKGAAKYHFNGGRYSRELQEDSALLLYNPQKALPLDLEVSAQSWTVSLLI